VKHAVQRGIWLPYQHLLYDQGKPWKILIQLAGRRTFRMQTSIIQTSKHSYVQISSHICVQPSLHLGETNLLSQVLPYLPSISHSFSQLINSCVLLH
jgi:hypothetical protein